MINLQTLLHMNCRVWLITTTDHKKSQWTTTDHNEATSHQNEATSHQNRATTDHNNEKDKVIDECMVMKTTDQKNERRCQQWWSWTKQTDNRKWAEQTTAKTDQDISSLRLLCSHLHQYSPLLTVVVSLWPVLSTVVISRTVNCLH